MFTGIVEQKGKVVSTNETDTGRRVVIAGEGLGELPVGASIAVNGVCLTAVSLDDDTVAMDVIPETLDRTNLGGLKPDDQVNLERPMPATGRFDGHIVQGHVDGVGEIVAIDSDDRATTVSVTLDTDLMKYLVEKGSVTIDGVSLTVAAVDETTVSVALIPHTLEVTTLGLRKEGDLVNLEVDVLAKYVERLVSFQQ